MSIHSSELYSNDSWEDCAWPLQVFLDEVNTSSCLGLFKEIIVDKTMDGEVCLGDFLQCVCVFVCMAVCICLEGAFPIFHCLCQC